jgi:membrane protease YdiL (CAAX protease family)
MRGLATPPCFLGMRRLGRFVGSLGGDFALRQACPAPNVARQRLKTRMRPLRSLLIFVLVVFVGGALLAPRLWWLVQALAPDSHLAHNPFHRYVNRSLLGLAMIGIWPLLRSLGARSCKEVGLVKPAGQWGRLITGAAMGFGSLACLAAIALAAHARALNDSLTGAGLAAGVLGAALTAAVVSVLEELLFRGAIFGALRRAWDWRIAALVSSMIYAIVHFMQNADLSGPVGWDSGLRLLPRMLQGFADWGAVVPGFFNLTLVGIMLAVAYQRTGNLYFSIGLHAGWIFWLKSYNLFTNPVPGASLSLFGTNKLIDGWLALALLATALIVLLRLPAARPKPAQP